MRAAEPASPTASYGPVSTTLNMSSAVMRPSFEKPIFTRPIMLGRARPMKCSSSRVMRIITGALHFLESSAGMMSEMAPVILLPKPPPVYSLMSTTFWVGRLGIAQPAGDGGHGLRGALRAGVHVDLAVLPVGHALRVSSTGGWCRA